MKLRTKMACLVYSGLLTTLVMLGCNGVTLPIDDLLNGGGDVAGPAETVELIAYASNTGGASGIALRPSDGALFAVSMDGLFGPIADGDDLSTMTPIGATNLADADLFDARQSSLTLAIADSGEFWIGSRCCTTMAVVAPGGGDAAPFEGLFEAMEIKPETLVIVPAGFEGSQIFPEQLLAGQETTFSRLVGVDVAGDRTVIDIDNPVSLNRNAHHLAFGLDGNLYSSRGTTALTQPGFQMIDAEGRPTEIAGTLGVAADTFVVLENGDVVLRGAWQTSPTTSERGVFLYDAASDETMLGVAIPADELSANDGMVVSSDGSTILLSLPNRDEIVRVMIEE